MEKKKGVIYFDNDKEFEDWALNPELDIVSSEIPYFTVDYSTAYKEEIDKGTKFCIKDAKSAIFKHKRMSCRTISLPVENLIFNYEV